MSAGLPKKISPVPDCHPQKYREIPMDAKKFLRLIAVVFLALGLFIYSGAVARFAFCEDIIIIEPEPDPELPPDVVPVDPPVEPPVTPPEEPPVIVPEGIDATINIDPNTINLRSNGNYITVYIELPAGYNPDDIDAASIKIVGVNGDELEQPISANTRHAKVGDEDRDNVQDLAVKFDRQKVEEELAAGNATIGLQGLMKDGKEFYGEDTVKVTGTQWRSHHRTKKWKFFWNIWKKHNFYMPVPVTPPAQGGVVTHPETKYMFSLSKHMAQNAQIKSVVLWLKTTQGWGSVTVPEKTWHYKMLKNWEPIAGRKGDLRCKNFIKGNGCEWDITSRVSADWTQGVTSVVVKFDEEKQAGKHPYLVVTYEKPAEIAAPEETAVQQQNLIAVGAKIEYKKDADSDTAIKLYFSPSEIKDMDQSTLNIYYWNTSYKQWVPAPNSVVNAADSSVSCEAVYSAYYKLMGAPKPAAVEPIVVQEAQQKPCALGQNYPNPFNPATTIGYSISADSHVTLKLYNTAGELVATMVDEFQSAGAHSVYYDAGESLSRGIYFYQLIAGDFVDTKRMVVLK